ncbi:MAG TPA: FKBP-type peptidyl-prolyl cis-trans isomerase [Candidatus Avirikenella pullistercoris]|nr:FKBP-type peptidyl-prolyl cis-trans isomerase [Candidatus Avirikenella pullistercoris]
MKKLSIIFSIMLMGAFASCNSAGSGSKITTTKDSLSYAIGSIMSQQLKTLGMTPDDVNGQVLAAAVHDALANQEPSITLQQSQELVQHYVTVVVPERNKKASDDFLAQIKKDNKNAVETPSGLVYEIVNLGDTTLHPTAQDTVLAHYTGTFPSGEVFDSSEDRGEPAMFPLSGVIPGWTEGLQLIGPGGEIKLYIPSSLAYGEYGSGPIGPNQALVFDVKLQKVMKAAKK